MAGFPHPNVDRLTCACLQRTHWRVSVCLSAEHFKLLILPQRLRCYHATHTLTHTSNYLRNAGKKGMRRENPLEKASGLLV
jgi:hypothetical protein